VLFGGRQYLSQERKTETMGNFVSSSPKSCGKKEARKSCYSPDLKFFKKREKLKKAEKTLPQT
jgi:hypothetical protein